MRWSRPSPFWTGLILLSTAAAQQEGLREAARLDGEGKCAESEPYYRKALAAGGVSPAVLNNAGNHYLLCGQPEEARRQFERLIGINPSHANANLQLARLAVDQKLGAKALAYLSRVNSTEPAVRQLRAEALHWAGRHEAALTILNALEKELGGDVEALFTLAAAFVRLGLYERAEQAFHAVLVRRPDDFDVLVHLGRAAARAQHYARARTALEAAARIRPGDVDVAFELGLVHAASKDYSRAVYLLAEARKAAPNRPDILLALARAAEDAGYYGDSALAYDEYLKLQPADDAARRDRARVLGYTGTRLQEGLKEMAAYVASHPRDPQGHYNLAQFTWQTEPARSLDQLAEALRLDPRFVPAHVSRAWLLHRVGRSAEAAAHLESALKITPDNLRALDLLGLIYLSLERPAEAEKALRRALAIDPEDPDVLMHLGRALMSLSRDDEAGRFLEKYQQVRPQRYRNPRREPGMIELATLPESDRISHELDRFRRLAKARPDDPVLQLGLARLLLQGGRLEEAATEFRQLLALNADTRLWEEAGSLLVRSEQYALARQFLERAAQERPEARLDLAMALWHTEGATAALKALDKVPDGERAADFLLMKARILDAAGRSQEANLFLSESLHQSGLRPELTQEATMMLLRNGQAQEALDLILRALESAPQQSDLLLTHAIVLGVMNQSAAAEKRLKEIESRWPEWDRPYLIHGLLLEREGRKSDARAKLKIAIALGSQDVAAKCAVARLEAAAGPDPTCACLQGFRQYVLAACEYK